MNDEHAGADPRDGAATRRDFLRLGAAAGASAAATYEAPRLVALEMYQGSPKPSPTNKELADKDPNEKDPNEKQPESKPRDDHAAADDAGGTALAFEREGGDDEWGGRG